MDKTPRYQWPALLINSLMFLLITRLTSRVTEGAPLSVTTVSILAPPTIAEDILLNDGLDRITPPEPTGRRITFFKVSRAI